MVRLLTRVFGILLLAAGIAPAVAQIIPLKDTLYVDSFPGRILQVDRVIIVGNKVTKNRIIERELSLKPGDTISYRRLEDVLNWDKNKLYNLRLFNTVAVRALELPDDHIDLLVELTERWYIFPVPILELADRNFNEWWNVYKHDFSRVNYGIRLYKNNFRGRNESLRLTLQFGFTQRYVLQYQIPNLDRRQKHGIGFSFDYSSPKNVASQTINHNFHFIRLEQVVKKTFSAGAYYTYRKSFFQTHTFGVNYNHSEVLDTVLRDNPIYYNNGKTSQQYFTMSYSFNSEKRDVVLYPLKGYQLNAYISKTGILPGDDVNEFEFNISYARHWPLGSNFFLSNFSSYFWSSPARQPYSVFNALGYRNLIVRGFENYVVEGPEFGLNKTTIKKRIFRKIWKLDNMPLEQFSYLPLAIYVKLFADFGYVRNYPYYNEKGYNQLYSNNLLAGIGGGVDFVTMYDFVLRVEYTMTDHNKGAFFLSARKEF